MAHAHHHNHHKSLKAILGISLAYMVAEIIGGLYSGSLALIADAGHMAIDSLAIALSLFATWIAHRPASPEKTYGYYRAEILAALVNGATLIAICFWIFYEAWERFSNPQPIQGGLMAGVAAGGLVINLISLALLHRHNEDSLNMRGVWLHVLTDTVGSVSAIVAAFLVWKWNWVMADPIISIIIGVLILYGAWKLVAECVHVLLEAVPKEMSITEIRKHIGEVTGVSDVHDLHVWTVASGMPSLSVHVRLKNSADATKVLESITHMLNERHAIEHATVQVETESFKHKNHDCSLEHRH